MDKGKLKILVPRADIAIKVQELGRDISDTYRNIEEPVVVVSVLKGSLVFTADLIREINVPVQLETLVASSYGDGSESSGKVRIEYKSFDDLKDRHVLLVDDISDSGRTFQSIAEQLQAYEPASIRFCAFLDKPSRRAVTLKPDFIGFSIPNEFVVGYGLDFAGYYRELPDVAVVIPEE